MNSSRLSELRKWLAGGDNVNQDKLDSVRDELIPFRNLYTSKSSEELLPLFDIEGMPLGTASPRWICHLLGLRHMSVHIQLIWKSKQLGETLILQVRSWYKSDSPGMIDISAGGHFTEKEIGPLAAAHKELKEEMGVGKNDLVNEKLEFVSGYNFNEQRSDEGFFNSEWRNLYQGVLKPGSLDNVGFNDKEVVGIYLCPVSEASALLRQNHIQMASALKFSLPRFLEYESEK